MKSFLQEDIVLWLPSAGSQASLAVIPKEVVTRNLPLHTGWPPTRSLSGNLSRLGVSIW